jgi:hypothetical protein
VHGSIFASQLRTWLPLLVPADQLSRLNPASLQAGPAVILTLPEAARDGVALAVAHGLSSVFLSSVFLAAAPVAAIGFLLVLFLPERPLRRFLQPHCQGVPTLAGSRE